MTSIGSLIPTDRIRRARHLSRSHCWLWRLLICIQFVGLLLVIGALPYISSYGQRITLLIDNNRQSISNGLGVYPLIFFIILALGNGLAVLGIWRLSRWPIYYLAVKLFIALFLVVSVLYFKVSHQLLYFVIPLFFILGYMIWTYQRLLRSLMPKAAAKSQFRQSQL